MHKGERISRLYCFSNKYYFAKWVIHCAWNVMTIKGALRL